MTNSTTSDLPAAPPGREDQPDPNPNQAVTLRLSPSGNPHTVTRGNSYEIRPFADLLDANGNKVPGNGRWTDPNIPGVSVGPALGYLNGSVRITSVTSNMSIPVTLTPIDYPHLSKSWTFQIVVRG